jgi:hypothetical protein
MSSHRARQAMALFITIAAIVICFSPRPDRQIWGCFFAGPAAPACDVLMGLVVPAETGADEGLPEMAPPPERPPAEGVAQAPRLLAPDCPSASSWPRMPPGETNALHLHHAACCADVAEACEGAALILESVAPELARRYRERACALGFHGCEREPVRNDDEERKLATAQNLDRLGL